LFAFCFSEFLPQHWALLNFLYIEIDTSWKNYIRGEIEQLKVVLVYLKNYIGSTENMADINNMNLLSFTPNFFSMVFKYW
jgi:hypothetical protein